MDAEIQGLLAQYAPLSSKPPIHTLATRGPARSVVRVCVHREIGKLGTGVPAPVREDRILTAAVIASAGRIIIGMAANANTKGADALFQGQRSCWPTAKNHPLNA